jgi:hypothetical protein
MLDTTDHTDAVEALQPHADITDPCRDLTEQYHKGDLKSFQGNNEKCQAVAEGRKRLADGEWGNWVTNILKLGCNRRTAMRVAQMMILVAEDKDLSDANQWFALPASWRTRYELVAILPERKQQLIDDGEIHSGLTREGAIALRKGRKQDRPVFILSAFILRFRRECERLGDAGVVNELLYDPGHLTPDELEEFGHELVRRASQWREATNSA